MCLPTMQRRGNAVLLATFTAILMATRCLSVSGIKQNVTYEKLQTYNVDPCSLTVSGFSSGAAFTMQFHVAFSRLIKGAGLLSGFPYGCSRLGGISQLWCVGNVGKASDCIQEVFRQYERGQIYNPVNLWDTPVFIYRGKMDNIVNPVASDKIEDIYRHFGARIVSTIHPNGVHGFPTTSFGGPCGQTSPDTHYINNCNFHATYVMLNHFYGNLVHPNGQCELGQGSLLEFDQLEFLPSPTPLFAAGMGNIGLIYVPSGCRDGRALCRFHVAFHGCAQGVSRLGHLFAAKTGFIEVAECNNIVVLFPQVYANALEGNILGCWDWWGYTGDNWLNRDGIQLQTVYNMIHRVYPNGIYSYCGIRGNDTEVSQQKKATQLIRET